MDRRRPPAAVVSERLDDFDRFAAVHSGEGLRVEQLSAGRFVGAYASVRGALIRATTLEFNQVIMIRGRATPGRFAVYAVSPHNADGLWHGRRLDPGRLVVHGPDSTADHRSARDCRLTELSVQAEDLALAALALLRVDVVRAADPWRVIGPPPDALAAIDRATRVMLALGADPVVLASSEGRQAEEDCLRMFIRAAFPARGGPEALDLPLGGRAALARRAEELIRSRLRDPVGMIELCSELGAGERTLRRACLERWGMGPIAYYRSLRLNAARAELKAGAASVSEVARRWGFHHLGNFAADYRRAFGERPSQTARR
ncbi:MAG: hypothetical protein BGO49_13930 [Planctomycetales bacterium 71-10]|nr:MAG: hypothetical protein BGO49_13930 [Planctomycetales bacterium 71-10]